MIKLGMLAVVAIAAIWLTLAMGILMVLSGGARARKRDSEGIQR